MPEFRGDGCWWLDGSKSAFVKMFLVRQTLSVDGCSIGLWKLLTFMKKIDWELRTDQSLHIKKIDQELQLDALSNLRDLLSIEQPSQGGELLGCGLVVQNGWAICFLLFCAIKQRNDVLVLGKLFTSS